MEVSGSLPPRSVNINRVVVLSPRKTKKKNLSRREREGREEKKTRGHFQPKSAEGANQPIKKGRRERCVVIQSFEKVSEKRKERSRRFLLGMRGQASDHG